VYRVKLKRGHFNNQGKFVSFKMQKTVIWKSMLEFDYIHLLELDSQVQQYENCDFKLVYSFGEQEHTLHPNFVVQRDEKSYLSYLLAINQKTEDQKQQLRFLINLCKEKRYNLEVVQEEEIRRQPRLSNAKIIIKYATKSLEDPLPRLLCYRLFKDKRIISLDELEVFFKHNSASKRDIFRLIYHGILSIDINRPIDAESPVTLVA
jgi:hypothetical protein